MTQKFETRIPLTFEQNDDNFFKKNFINLFQCDSFENLDSVSTTLSSNSFKVISKKYNKTVVLSKITFSQKYTLNDFIIDLKKYQKVDLHENILKFIGIVKQSMNEFILVHEYAYDGTLRQYLKQNFKVIDWSSKLRLAKQLISAVKCLHENDIIHTNLHSERIFVHKGDIKICVFRHQNKFSNKFKYIQYIDPQYLINIDSYKLNKSSDIYSIGVLLWEISNGITLFESGLYHDSKLLNAIISNKPEYPRFGTPKKYIKIYTECLQHNSNQRPTIQHIFKELNNDDCKDLVNNNIDDNDNSEACRVNMKCKEYSSTNLLQHYIDLRNEITEKLEIITSILKALKMNHCDNDQRNNIINDSRSLTTNSNISNITKSQDNISNNDQKFLYDLNQLFITQFNIQGVSKNCANFIINNINNYMNENNKNPDEIFVQYYNHQYKYYFTSIIGFFYEYGIGTTIDYFKAFEMYKQAADNFYFSHNNSLIENNLLKENHIIGLISIV
ncbi:kinase-like protein [Gigaspora margarita]|uniref:Kinase-like protein n=1 Tax=Gigaspora margarita TaxID=4874 RepID=A0A8H4EIK6_GIGMA|nr:kinase-like protein [Gigaspora margarita]